MVLDEVTGKKEGDLLRQRLYEMQSWQMVMELEFYVHFQELIGPAIRKLAHIVNFIIRQGKRMVAATAKV